MSTKQIGTNPHLKTLTAALACLWLFASSASANTLAGWDAHALSGYGPSPLPANVADPNLTVGGLTRGSGVGTSGTAAARGWGGVNWMATSEAAAITANQFATCTVAANAGYTVSFATVSQFNYRRSTTGPTTGVLQYQIGSGNFVDIATVAYTSTASAGAALAAVDLSSIADLQNIAAGNVVTFRLVNYGGSGASGSWYIYDVANSPADDFEIQGTISPVPTGSPPGNVVVTPSNLVANAACPVTFTASATGDPANYFWYQETPAGTNLIASASTSTLTLAGVCGADTAKYQVILTNAYGAATSAVVSLTVCDPAILAPPANQTNVLNDLDFFSGTAVGSQPYQMLFYYHGALLASSTFNTLTNALTIYVTNNPAATNLAGYYLVASNQFGMVTSAVAMATIALTPPVEITRWDFNATNNCSPTNPAASFGCGTAMPVPNPAVTNFAFAPGTVFDPCQYSANPTNLGWALNGFAAGTANKTAGFQFSVSTAGFTNLLLTWSERHSATASKYMRLQYTTNGTDYLDGDVLVFSEVAYQFYSSDFSAKPGVDNNPNFGFRLVAEQEATAIGNNNTNYVGTASSFGGGGTIRVDLMTVFGSAIGTLPIPLALRFDGTNVVLTWDDPLSAFSLQAAAAAGGVYVTVAGATSPFTNAITGVQQFFRLKSN